MGGRRGIVLLIEYGTAIDSKNLKSMHIEAIRLIQC